MKTNSIKSPSRRQFIQQSAATTGAFVLGMYLPLTSDAATNPASLTVVNAWVQITPDNQITLICARSEMGQDVYTSMPALLAEELNIPLSMVKVQIAGVAPIYINALLGGQITGGSSSVREAFDKLRIAGAATRSVLVQAAANRWSVPITDCKAMNGKVSHAGGKSATYGELAAEAAKLPLPEKPALKSPANFMVIGKESMRRLDTPAKVSGTAVFGIDVKIPGMAIASLAQCPVIGGTPRSVDSADAMKVSGVIKVVQISDGVAVLAKNFYAARKGRDALKVTWNEGAGASISNAGMRKQLESGLTKPGAVIQAKGDATAALGNGKQLSAQYFMPYLAHSTMEPVNCSAVVADGKCRIIGPIQFQQGAQAVAAVATGLKPEDVTVETTFLGGGFGRKLELDFIRQAAEIAKASGMPVKMLWTKEDDITHDFYRPMSVHQMDASLSSEGKISALKTKMVSQSVTARAFPAFVKDGNDPFMVEGSANLTYEIPNLEVRNVIEDSGIRVGYWRSVSNTLNAFAIESFMDEAAKAAGKDPVAFRLSALSKEPRAAAVLKMAVQKSGYQAGSKRFGVAQMECYGTYSACVVELDPYAASTMVKKITFVSDCGIAIHPDQARAQLTGGILYGLGAALYDEITIEQGRVQQSNFNNYPSIRMNQAPIVEVHLVASQEKPGGLGEVGVPLVAPALVNAIAAATGKRIRELPIKA
ncbi:xanthine dehydrogenase family protein molybdopterin-binding subunit [Polynucleobacter paneuropaeus]|jgi:isoquinoline 1-oxidoreductase beta subunit|uniref:Xanthine dehydrogenase family protein molybdopterin-binding subunit n=1 Tax=Polynucleobacter paneuropaeus TaxID=2527775 RepID=A0AAE2YLE3_9BURK|nr:molybdopterin cofactor-binding domain-containing protein [Polynucleobacter paneuropaeus]MBT8521954.1 xanthine dehydrogenase family protein molybdopterin-binding subunit [Polynucleobacter paneuropaeus]MBT8539314.1 xanthine dehydrogenase family protein molybdopterin-binding subunit [Polynucleobacter paneuropaeus]MBT8544509.1 xanthine dehydrogenase family protein molybdopterin-binding subunit [Polynucleobacter paneuropaeus]MBT8588935.1 xanthine dehydrogenase family protein molybdopterin-binding